MKHCIAQDSSFVVSLMDTSDPNHRMVWKVFTDFWKFRNKIKIIIPPLALYEVIVVLTKKGISCEEVERKILRLIKFPEVAVISIAEISAFKHCKNLLNVLREDEDKIIRTWDFLMISTAVEHDAQIITLDKKMVERSKIEYPRIYNLMVDADRGRFLSELKIAVGES